MKEVSVYTNQQYYCIDLKHIYQSLSIDMLLEAVVVNYSKIKRELVDQSYGLVKGADIVIEEQIMGKRL